MQPLVSRAYSRGEGDSQDLTSYVCGGVLCGGQNQPLNAQGRRWGARTLLQSGGGVLAVAGCKRSELKWLGKFWGAQGGAAGR